MNPRPGTSSPAHLTDWTKRHAKQNHKAHLRQRPGSHRYYRRTWPVAHAGLGGEQPRPAQRTDRSEEHTSELQSLMRISYAVFCLNKKKKNNTPTTHYLVN